MLRWFPIVASIVFLFGSTAATGAEDRNAMTTLNAAISGQWVQFSVVVGRVSLQGTQVGPIQTGPAISANRKDQLSIRPENGETAMAYEWSNGKEQYSIDACGVTRLHIHRGPKGISAKSATVTKPKVEAVDAPFDKTGKPKSGAKMDDAESRPKSAKAENRNERPQSAKANHGCPIIDFVQTPREKSILTVESEGERQIFAADTLWHLFILYPEQARKHLAPLLQPLLPNMKLAETADAVEKALLRNAGNSLIFDRSNWNRWVAELGDENFARREAADRALRGANPALLVYLQKLDFERLDAEQQFRIRRIIETFSAKINNDTPEQAASWLSGDPAIWLAFLGRPDVSVRRIAAKQLATILEEPIPIDPEADPVSQKAQFDRLRASRSGGKEKVISTICKRGTELRGTVPFLCPPIAIDGKEKRPQPAFAALA